MNTNNFKNPKTKYAGHILTDITSFTIVQDLFDNPKGANLLHLINLESVIEILLFHEKIWVVGPTYFGHNFEVKMPQILKELIKAGIVEVYSPNFCSSTEDFLIIKKEVEKMMFPDKIEAFYSNSEEIINDLKIYSDSFKYDKQQGSLELARKVGITDKRMVPLYAHLVRTNVNIKSLHKLKEKRETSYWPHVARVSLMKKMCNLYEKKSLPAVRREIVEKLEKSEKQKRKNYSQNLRMDVELDIPILTTIIFSKSSKISDIFDEVLVLRESNNLKLFRRWYNEFQDGIYNDDITIVEKYRKQIKEAIIFEEMPFKSIDIKDVLQSIFPIGNLVISPSAKKIHDLASSPLVTKMIDKVKPYFSKKDLFFLINLKKEIKSVKRSRDEFEKLFKTKLKM